MSARCSRNSKRSRDREPSADKVYALSELAFLGGKRLEGHDKRAALDLYGAAVLHAYDYLFDERFAATRNPYDPAVSRRLRSLQRRAGIGAADRLRQKELVPGATKTINTASGAWDVTCVLGGGHWRPEDFERFEFVSDYKVTGLKNLYLTHGLGVP